MDQETKQVLAQAASKVRELRGRNQVLQAKVDTMDLLAAFLFAKPIEQSGGAEEDIAWRIDQLIRKSESP